MYITFGEEDKSALAGFYTDPLSWSNWDLEMLVFQGGGKPENPEKNPQSKARTNNKLKPQMAPGRNRTWATLL